MSGGAHRLDLTEADPMAGFTRLRTAGRLGKNWRKGCHTKTAATSGESDWIFTGRIRISFTPSCSTKKAELTAAKTKAKPGRRWGTRTCVLLITARFESTRTMICEFGSWA